MPWWLEDPNTRWVLGGCLLLGLGSGVLGSFALLRRRSLMGDALAHAALPGVCLAFLITGARAIGPLFLGALLAGLAGAYCIHVITRHTRIKEDTSLALVLSVFFGFGIVLLTLIQSSGRAQQAGLDQFIFGQAASLVRQDVQVMAACAGLICLATAALFKEFKLLCFDPGFGRGIGFPTGVLDGALMFLIVLIVVTGLQAVGVVLMAAMLITPAAAARLWTDRLDRMVWLAGGFGAAAGVGGTLFSTQVNAPTGPLIVLAATAAFLVSLVFAPRRGLLFRLARRLAVRARVARENALRALYEHAEAGARWDTDAAPEELARLRKQSPAAVARQLARLEREGLVARRGDRARLTAPGLAAAHRIVRNHRLWEMFLMHEGQLAADHVDRDADLIEHHLPPEIVAELERLLRVHGREMTLPASVHPVGT